MQVLYLEEDSNARVDWLKVYGRTDGTSLEMQQRETEIPACKESFLLVRLEYRAFLHSSIQHEGNISRVSVGSAA